MCVCDNRHCEMKLNASGDRLGGDVKSHRLKPPRISDGSRVLKYHRSAGNTLWDEVEKPSAVGLSDYLAPASLRTTDQLVCSLLSIGKWCSPSYRKDIIRLEFRNYLQGCYCVGVLRRD